MITHTLAAVLLELAYLATGILLCYMGRKLLETGVESKTRLEGEIHGNKWVLLTSSPGIVFALCGLGIILYAIVTQSEYEETIGRVDPPPQNVDGGQNPEHGQRVYSKLFEQLSADAGLKTRVAIYALQHRALERVDQNVESLVKNMPTRADAEPWPQTHDRVAEILRKNPSSLSKILLQPEYEWIGARDRLDGTLSAFLDLELQRLSADQQ